MCCFANQRLMYRSLPLGLSSDLANNKLKSMAGLSALVHLKKIDLGANRIRVMDEKELSGLVNLEELWIGKNKIENIQGLEKVRLWPCKWLWKGCPLSYRFEWFYSMLTFVFDFCIYIPSLPNCGDSMCNPIG